MNARTRSNLLHWLRKSYHQACRCQVMAWRHGLWDKAFFWGSLQVTLAQEINALEWEEIELELQAYE